MAATKAEALPIRLIDGEGERLVLSNMLACPEFCKAILPQIGEDYFAIDRNRRVFRLLVDAAEQGHEPGISGAFRRLLDIGKTPDDLGLPLLSALAFENTVDLPNPAPWINALRRKAAERSAWHLAERMRAGLEAGTDTVEDLASAREELRRLETELEPTAPSIGTINETVASIGIDALLAEPRGVIGSPWPRLTEMLNGGPRPGELIIVAARPSIGKTTATLLWALAATRSGHRTELFSLEMPVPDLMKRVLSAQGSIPHSLLVTGDLDQRWRVRVAQTLEQIGDYPLVMSDKHRTLSSIIAKIAGTKNLGLVIVDYIGLIETQGRFENRNQEVSTISRRLKLAAMDYGVPIICAHQLNRANENESRRPQLSDLRDSGSLEQDADCVLLLDCPATRKRSDAPKDAVDLTIAKQRNGPRGHTINLRSEFHFCRLVEVGAADDPRDPKS